MFIGESRSKRNRDRWMKQERGIMRIADKGVDHKSLWIVQRSQQHSLEGCQEREGK